MKNITREEDRLVGMDEGGDLALGSLETRLGTRHSSGKEENNKNKLPLSNSVL